MKELTRGRGSDPCTVSLVLVEKAEEEHHAGLNVQP